MEDQLKQLLESLPVKPPRSRLAPYAEFIEELRRLGRTYRDIAAILAEKCQLNVSASAIHDFVRIHSRARRKRGSGAPELHGRPLNLKLESNDVAAAENRGKDAAFQRIAALKRRNATVEPVTQAFRFNPSEPLWLKKARKPDQSE